MGNNQKKASMPRGAQGPTPHQQQHPPLKPYLFQAVPLTNFREESSSLGLEGDLKKNYTPVFETTYLKLGLEPSQNLAWDVSPCVWDSNPAKTHGTWFQDLMKLRFLMSHHRKSSVRDKVIGKKCIYSDLERSTDKVWAMAESECSHQMWCG